MAWRAKFEPKIRVIGVKIGRIEGLKHDKETKANPEAQSENEVQDEPTEAGAKPDPESNTELAFLREELLKTQAERDSYKDQLLRSLADFQNFRKRVEADKQVLRSTAKEAVVLDLITVLDNFERTVAAADGGAKLESILEGIRLTDRQLRQMLEQHGVKRIDSEGKSFDPELHEAIAVEVSDEHDENTVTTELATGYKLAEKVIRPARVKVSKKP